MRPLMEYTLNSSFSSGWLWVIGIASLVWLASVVHVANARTKDPLDRIVWLLVVLALHIVGTLLYWLFANSEAVDPIPNPPTEEQIKDRANRGTLV